MKDSVLCLFAGFILGIFVILMGSSDETIPSRMEEEVVNNLLENKKISDSLVVAMNDYIKVLEERNTVLEEEKDSLETDIDSILVRTIKLTKVEVTDKEVKEALEWIESYNDSLR